MGQLTYRQRGLVLCALIIPPIFATSARYAASHGLLTREAAAMVSSFLCGLLLAGVLIWAMRLMRRAEEDRDRLAEEMRRTHERYVLAVEGSSDGLWDWNVVTGEVFFSPRWLSMLGYGEHELPHSLDTWKTLIHPEDAEQALAAVKDYHDGRSPLYELEHRLRHKDGSYRWVLSRGALLRNPKGLPLRMSGSHTDITARKNAEEALRESELRFRQLAENIREAFWLVGAPREQPQRTEIVYISPMWEHIWGRPVPALSDLTQVWMDSLHPDDRERALATGARAREGYEQQYRILRPDGELRWVRDRAFPIKDADGVLLRVAGVSEDITERKRLEEELRAARDEALASASAKSRFLANVSHELRTPLNAVIGMNELLLETPLTPAQKEHAAVARDAGRGLLLIIDDLLDFARLEAGRMTLQSAAFDPRGLLEEVERLFRHKAAAKSLRLEARADAAMPPSLRGDAARLRQVLLNFVGNALKFTDRGSILLEAAALPRGERDVLLRLSVTDTGIGIPADVREKLFTPFYQADSSLTRLRDGAGLGLAICRQIAELMGGSLYIESVPGEGSTFRFEVVLPLAAGEAAPAPPARREDTRGLRVLLVEDNAVNRRVALAQLDSLGCETDFAEDGARAIETASHRRYDVILMDCAMPRLDGYAAAAELRRREPPGRRTPIIALTAGARPEDRERCLAAGMDDHLSKPVSLDALAAALVRWGGPIDAAVLERALELVGAEGPRWRAAYLEDARRLLGELTAPGADDETRRRAAHTLKGASAALGARRLAALCGLIEAGAPLAPAELERELELVRRGLGA